MEYNSEEEIETCDECGMLVINPSLWFDPEYMVITLCYLCDTISQVA